MRRIRRDSASTMLPRRRSGGCRIGGAGRPNPGLGRECGGAEKETYGITPRSTSFAESHLLEDFKIFPDDVQAAETMHAARTARRSSDLRDR